VEGPGNWSAPGPVLALGGPACTGQVMYYLGLTNAVLDFITAEPQ